MKHNIKILIVEDETIVAFDIRNAILKLGFNVTNIVSNYNDTINSIKNNKPDLILMDIRLEDTKDGIEIAHEINKITNIPILFLTAFADDETINRAIQTNPIGYLIKPFKREELNSTILLAMYKINKSQKLNFNDDWKYIGNYYYFNKITKELYYKEYPIKLSKKEGLLLSILINDIGNIISFDKIEHKLWPDTSVSSSALRTLTYRLRSKLEYKIIETIPFKGCRIKIPNNNLL